MAGLLRFKGRWRSYQRRILDNLDYHLMDEKLHIIAAPGAGKTTLGIEVISRLNRHTLVLCPTNTIKNQWYDRICKSFLDEKDYGIVSTNIREPKVVTIITYQALLAAFSGGDIEQVNEETEPEEEVDENSITSSKRFNLKKADEIIKILKSAKISLLCFDEAHHLRKEWWKALTYLTEELKPKQTIALTATPPYDVDYGEWERYEMLCGEIDEVISIPELVKNGDLCPHQDFIHFSLLRDSEKDFIKKYNENVLKFMDKLLSDKQLLLYIRGLDFMKPDNNYTVEQIFENPEFYVSMASLLRSTGSEISKEFLDLFDAKVYELPRFNVKQAKIFFNGFLVSNKDDFPGLEDKIADYYNFAKKLGLVQNKRIILDDSTKIQKQITGSLGKLDSIIQIVELETLSLGKDLRMVILSDYIKANDTDNSHLGVVPIWRTVKSKFQKISVGVLCGSLIILPKSAENAFVDLLDKNSVPKDNVSISPYKEDDNFIKITPKDSAKHKIVALVTEMFNRGEVNILIGTQALLGEGWDAPCINSLILSSTVSSYMLSNQMRGRAIRIDKNNPEKISNIWHLASVKVPRSSDLYSNMIFTENYSSDEIDILNSGFYDINQLTKRFEGFEAPSYFDEHEVVSGISRVFADKNYKAINVRGERVFLDLNRATMQLAKNREQTKNWWQNALYLGYNRGEMRFNTGVETPNLTMKTLSYKGYRAIVNSILYLFVSFLVGVRYASGFQYFLFIWFIALIACLSYVFVKFLRTGTVEAVLKQIAIVHLEALSYQGLIKTSLKNAGISVVKGDESSYITCKNLSVEENNILIKAIKEFLDPIDNPRYLLVKHEKFGKIIDQVDYFAIPAVLSSTKKDVKIFAELWKKYIGSCEIVYTRNIEGRKLLLKARKMAFSATKRSKTKKISRWG